MAEITSSGYGYIEINNKRNEHDVYILVSGSVEKRDYGHDIKKEEVERILEGRPEVIFIGKGTSGMARLAGEAKKLLKEKNVEVVKGKTQDIREEFNEISNSRRTAAIIHVTC